MDLAFSLARRSTCLRAKVGAVLVKGNRIVGTGYNGAPHGCKHCDDTGSCLVGTDGSCKRTIHAEINALISTSIVGTTGGNGDLVLYCTHYPCSNCLLAMVGMGVKTIYYCHQYKGRVATDMVMKDLKKGVITIEKAPFRVRKDT